MLHRLCALVVLLMALAFAPALHAQSIKLAVTDLVGLEELQREFGAFVQVLEQATGYQIEFFPVTNRTAAAEALRFKKIDFVMTGPAEYVVVNKRSKAIPVVGLSRPDYFSVVFVRADSEIQSIADLKGRKVALGSVGSTSKHLGPLQVLADHGLQAGEVELVHTKLPVAWEALKRGDIAAIGWTNDKFVSMREKEHADGGLAPGAFRVIGRGRDLPNDMLLAGSHVEQSVVATLRKAFTDHSARLVEAILTGEDNQKYQGMVFLPTIQDRDYDYVRMMYATAGYPEYADFLGD